MGSQKGSRTGRDDGGRDGRLCLDVYNVLERHVMGIIAVQFVWEPDQECSEEPAQSAHVPCLPSVVGGSHTPTGGAAGSGEPGKPAALGSATAATQSIKDFSRRPPTPQ